MPLSTKTEVTTFRAGLALGAEFRVGVRTCGIVRADGFLAEEAEQPMGCL